MDANSGHHVAIMCIIHFLPFEGSTKRLRRAIAAVAIPCLLDDNLKYMVDGRGRSGGLTPGCVDRGLDAGVLTFDVTLFCVHTVLSIHTLQLLIPMKHNGGRTGGRGDG